MATHLLPSLESSTHRDRGAYIHIYIYIYANFIEHNRHFMPTYSLLDPFEFPYYFYRIRGELIKVKKTNVIYKFKCPLGDCISDNNNIYVGLTSTTLSRRLTMHLSDTSSIAQHLKKHSCPTTQLRKNSHRQHNNT